MTLMEYVIVFLSQQMEEFSLAKSCYDIYRYIGSLFKFSHLYLFFFIFEH